MLWLPVPGGGWALQPTDPVLQGCVITTGTTPRGFGFKAAVRTIGALGAILAMLWMCADGHTIEVVGAVLAAVLIEVTADPVKHVVQYLGETRGPDQSGGRS